MIAGVRLRVEDIRVPVTVAEAQSAIDLIVHRLDEMDLQEKETTDPDRLDRIAGARSIWDQKLSDLLYWHKRLVAGEPGTSVALDVARAKIEQLELENHGLQACVCAADDRARAANAQAKAADDAFFDVRVMEDLQIGIEKRELKLRKLGDRLAQNDATIQTLREKLAEQSGSSQELEELRKQIHSRDETIKSLQTTDGKASDLVVLRQALQERNATIQRLSAIISEFVEAHGECSKTSRRHHEDAAEKKL